MQGLCRPNLHLKLLGFTTGKINQEQVLTLIMNKTDTVEPVEQSIDYSHPGQRFAVLGLFIQWANCCAKHKVLAIR